MGRVGLIPLAMLAIGLGISAAAAHSWYEPECCSGRDCFPVPGRSLADGTYVFEVLGKQYVKTEREIRPSRDQDFHACQPAHKAEPVCFYAPRAGS
jgi:hypothetical protein